MARPTSSGATPAATSAIWLMSGTSALQTVAVGNLPTTWAVDGRRYEGRHFLAQYHDRRVRDVGDERHHDRPERELRSAAPQLDVSPASAISMATGQRDILWRDTAGDVAIWLMNGTPIHVKHDIRQCADQLVASCITGDLQRRRQERYPVARRQRRRRRDLVHERHHPFTRLRVRQRRYELERAIARRRLTRPTTGTGARGEESPSRLTCRLSRLDGVQIIMQP